jgi:hypothetical protein
MPSVLGHLEQANRDLSGDGLWSGWLWLNNCREELALLAEERGLRESVLGVQRDGEVEHGRRQSEASKLQNISAFHASS